MTIIFDPIDILCKSIFEQFTLSPHSLSFWFVCTSSTHNKYAESYDFDSFSFFFFLFTAVSLQCVWLCTVITKMGEFSIYRTQYIYIFMKEKIDCNGMKIVRWNRQWNLRYALCSTCGHSIWARHFVLSNFMIQNIIHNYDNFDMDTQNERVKWFGEWEIGMWEIEISWK